MCMSVGLKRTLGHWPPLALQGFLKSLGPYPQGFPSSDPDHNKFMSAALVDHGQKMPWKKPCA